MLSDQNFKMLYVPEGFAHGFCTLASACVVQYKVDEAYDPATEGGILWNDPELAINWPTDDPVISARDAGQPGFAGFDSPFHE